MNDIKNRWISGEIGKKDYWTIMREKYSCVFPVIQQLLEDNDDCKSVVISSDHTVLEKKNGLKMLFDFGQTICRAETDLFMGIDSEKDDMDCVKQYLKEHPCKNVLDIGANVGLFSLELYLDSKNITYHVFEPIPTTYENLKKTALLNNVDPNHYKTYNLGLSDKNGSFTFYLPAACEAASLQPINDEYYLKQSDEMGNYTGQTSMKEVECKVTTVDEIVSKESIEDIGFIKIDVEGNELFVLRGAQKTLTTYRPLVYCELLRKHAKRFGYHPNEVIALMDKIGYCCKTYRNGRLVDVPEITEDTMETNFYFIAK